MNVHKCSMKDFLYLYQYHHYETTYRGHDGNFSVTFSIKFFIAVVTTAFVTTTQYTKNAAFIMALNMA